MLAVACARASGPRRGWQLFETEGMRKMTNTLDPDDFGDEQPMFESLEAAQRAYGWSDALREQIRRNMEATDPDRPAAPGDTVH